MENYSIKFIYLIFLLIYNFGLTLQHPQSQGKCIISLFLICSLHFLRLKARYAKRIKLIRFHTFELTFTP